MSRLGTFHRSPLFWILLLALVLRLPGLLWGLPGSDGWDDDGVAPRNFLVGLALTYASGSYFAYPPLHMVLLALVTLPGVVIALAKAHALTHAALITEFIKPPYMTFFALAARLVSIVMSLGTIVVIARMAELIAGRRASWLAAFASVLNPAFTYYGVVTNLDGPANFWCVLSLFFWMRLVIEGETKHARWAALSAAAALATKDQSYAAFLLAIPILLGAWLLVDARPRKEFPRIFVPIAGWSGIAILALLAVDGAITNPVGFAHRIAFLLGPASQDYTEYVAGVAGYGRLIGDIWTSIPRFYPLPAVFLAVLGIGLVALRFRQDRTKCVAGFLPLLAAISFTLTFNLVVLRTGNRFLLLQFLLVAVYIGVAADWLLFAISAPNARLFFRVSLPLLAGFALYQCIGIDAAFLFDPRYDAERWLGAHISPGATIETYGPNAFLPRFPASATVARVDAKPLEKRNPQPGLHELRVPPQQIEARHPQFIVVNSFVVRDEFALQTRTMGSAGVVPVVVDSGRPVHDQAAQSFFRDLYDGRLRYRLVHLSTFNKSRWQSIAGYESLAQPIMIFERD